MPSSNLVEEPEAEVAEVAEAPEMPSLPQLIMIETDDEAAVCGPGGVCL